MDRITQDNLEVFERLLFQYEKEIFRYVYRLLNRREDAEDVTQETFIKIYKNIHALDPQKNIRSWIYKIATNTAYDWLRKKRNNPELFIIDDADYGFETIDEKATYYTLGTAKDLEKALAAIKPIYKTVLLLFYREGLEYQEIAEILSIPINTVKTYLRRAKQALKEELEIHDS